TKRGGKNYQGSLFYNNKNSALAAWTLLDKGKEAIFAPTPAQSKFPTPYFNLNETGGSFGGAGSFCKEKTFFLAFFERRWSVAPVPFQSSFMPHASLYSGDFSKLSNSAKPAVPGGVALTPEELATNTVLVTDNKGVTTRRFVTIPSRLLNPTTQ